jgi:hypothetical protein
VAVNDAVILNIESRVGLGVFKEEVDFVFSCAPVDGNEVL